MKKDQTCWANKSPLQTASILVLCVAVPFMVVMVVIYVLFIFVWHASERCDRMCSLQPEGEWKGFLPQFKQKHPSESTEPDGDPMPIPLIPGFNDYDPWPERIKQLKKERQTLARTFYELYYLNPDKKNKRRQLNDGGSTEYYYSSSVVPLLGNMYLDDGLEKVIQCPVAVISDKWLLTTISCMENYNVESLSVRENSDYWSKDGDILAVKRMVSFKYLIALELNATLADCSPLLIPEDPYADSVAYVFVWDDKFVVPLKKRKKFKEIDAVEVTLYDARENGTLGYGRFDDECFHSLAPLVDETLNYLFGFVLNVDCDKNIFRFFDIVECRDWLKSIIK